MSNALRVPMLTPEEAAAASVFTKVCPSCMGSGHSGYDDRNGQYQSNMRHCFRCAGRGSVEYIEIKKGATNGPT